MSSQVLEVLVKSREEGMAQVSSSVEKLKGQLARMQDSVKQSASAGIAMGTAFATSQKGVAILEQAVGTTIATIRDATTNFVKFSSELSDLSERTGVSAEGLQKLQYAGSLVGVEMGTVANAINQMQKRLETTPKEFVKLGLSIADLKAMKPDEQFIAVAEAIRGIQEPAKQTTAAWQTMGRSAISVLALLKSDLANNTAEAERFGAVMSGETVRSADELGDAVTKLSSVYVGLGQNVLAFAAKNPEAVSTLEATRDIVGALSKDLQDGEGPARRFFDIFLDFARAAPGGGIVTSLGQIQDAVRAAADTIEDALPKIRTKLASESAPSLDEELARIQREALKVTKEQVKEHDRAEAAAKRHAEAVRKQLASAYREAARDLKDFEAEIRRLEGHGRTGFFGGEAATQKEIDRELAALREKTQAMVDEHRLAEELARDATRQALQDAARETRAKNYASDVARLKELTGNWSQALGDLAHTFEVMGIKADSVLGRMLRGVTLAVAGWQQHNRVIEEANQAQARANGLMALYEATGNPMAKVQADAARAVSNHIKQMEALRVAILAAAAAVEIYKQNVQNLSGTKAAASGAAQGAAAGAQTGTWMGVVIGAIGGAFIGWFSGRQFRELAKQAGDTLGVEMTAGLAKAVDATRKKFREIDPQTGMVLFNLSPEAAGLLNLDKAMESSLRKMKEFTPQVLALIAGVAAGAIPVKEGIEQIGKAWSAMSAEAGEGRVTKEMLAIMAAAKAAGVQIKAISDFIRKLATDAAPALAAQFKAVDRNTADAADQLARLARLTAAAFDALNQSGLSVIQVFEQLGPTIDAAVAAYERLGLPIPDVLGNIVQFWNLIDANKELVLAVTSTAAILKLAAAGFGDLKDAMALVQSDYDRLIGAGFSFEQATYLQRDALRELDHLVREGLIPGLTDLQRRQLDLARERGWLDPTPAEKTALATEKLVIIMAELARHFGVILPKAIQDYIDSLNRIPKTIPGAPPPPDPNTPPPTPGDPSTDPTNPDYHATGGYFMRRHLAWIAEREPEWVVPRSRQREFAEAMGGDDRRRGKETARPAVIHNHIYLDGVELRNWISRQQEAGFLN